MEWPSDFRNVSSTMIVFLITPYALNLHINCNSSSAFVAHRIAEI